jgi:hypothetical protein
LKIILLITLLTFMACKPETAVKSKGFSYESSGISTAAPTTGKVYLTSPFVGAQNYNFYPNITLMIANVVSGETINLYSDSKCLKLVARKKSDSTSVFFNLGPISVENHKYYTNSTNINGTSACSTEFATYNFQGIAPKIASTITLKSPLTTPNSNSRPIFTLTGLETSEIVSLYTSSSCSLGSLVATALVTNSSMDLQSIPLAPGAYNFYTDSSTSTGKSTCSTIYASYEYEGVIPSVPVSLKLNYPISSPNYIDQPKILVTGGIVNGDTANIYSDASCSTLLGSAATTSNSIEITLNKLTTIQTYDLYAKATNVKGASACSSKLLSYTYLGPVPTVAVSWNASKESIVNRENGGYRVYYSELPITSANRNNAKVKEVKYTSGPTTPTTVDITDLAVGTYYFRVYAFGKLDSNSAESESTASDQFSITLP